MSKRQYVDRKVTLEDIGGAAVHRRRRPTQRAGARALSIENPRHQVCEVVRMTNKDVNDIWTRIEEQRANYQSIIDNANKAIENARELVKEARKGLDSLPVAKVRRSKKARVDSLVEDSGYTRADAKVLVAEDMDEYSGEKLNAKLEALAAGKLPSALEMFPNGIERITEEEP